MLDLRSGSSSCTDNPLVRFLNLVNRGEEREIVVIARENDVPVGLLRLVASRSGYEVVEVRDLGDGYQARLVRRA